MGIDNIGRKAPPVAPTHAEGASSAGSPTGPFSTAPETAPATASVMPSAGTALERLHSGQLTLDGYLDAKVDEATAHLQGLGPAAVGAIRDALREQLATDPGLGDLLRTAQGAQGDVHDE